MIYRRIKQCWEVGWGQKKKKTRRKFFFAVPLFRPACAYVYKILRYILSVRFVSSIVEKRKIVLGDYYQQ